MISFLFFFYSSCKMVSIFLVWLQDDALFFFYFFLRYDSFYFSYDSKTMFSFLFSYLSGTTVSISRTIARRRFSFLFIHLFITAVYTLCYTITILFIFHGFISLVRQPIFLVRNLCDLCKCTTSLWVKKHDASDVLVAVSYH